MSAMIDPLRRIPRSRREPLVAVRARGLEAVMAVGEHHGRSGDGVDDASDVRAVDREHLVHDALVVGPPGQQLAALEQGRQSGSERQPPDRVEVGAGLAQQRQPVALGLGHGALVGQDRRVASVVERREPERAEHPHRAAGGAVGVGVGHPVGVEPGFRIGRQHTALLPGVEEGGRDAVSIGAVGAITREDQPHCVVGRRGLE